MNGELITAAVGTIGLVFGGAAKALLDVITQKATKEKEQKIEQEELNASLRDEFRRDIMALKAELVESKSDNEAINTKYYKLLEDYLILRARTEQVKAALDTAPSAE